MANAILGTPIYSDLGVLYTPALSGGSWQSALPLANLQDRRLAVVARSTDATTGSTQFVIDLGVARAVRLVALVAHNLSSAATVTVKAGSDGVTWPYSSGSFTPWPAGLTAEDLVGLNWPVLHIPASVQTYRYWQVLIVDTGNAAGYVQAGRLCVCGGYQPTLNLSPGAKVGIETDTVRTVTDGGAAIYLTKPIRRTWAFTLSDTPEAEAFGSAWKLQRLLGTSGQLFFVYDPADAVAMWERSFLAVLKALTALDAPYAGRFGVPFQLVEEL